VMLAGAYQQLPPVLFPVWLMVAVARLAPAEEPAALPAPAARRPRGGGLGAAAAARPARRSGRRRPGR